MGKMKKVVAGVMLASTVGMSGCFNTVSVKDFEVVVPEQEFWVGDTFSLEGFVLNLDMSDNTSKTVQLKDDMIVTAPDMTTAGEKTVVVKYNGKEYTFNIVVSGYTTADMLAKLEEFKTAYQKAKQSGDISFSVSGDFVAKYLGEEASTDFKESLVSFAEGDLKVDDLSAHLYDTLVKNLVESGLESTSADILDANKLLVKMDYARTLNKLSGSVENFNYINFLFNEVIFPESEDVDYAESITEGLYSIFGMESDIAKRTLEDFVRNNFNKIKNDDKIDIMVELEKFNNIVQQYSSNVRAKDIVTVAYSKIETSVDAGKADKNVLSSFVRELADLEGDVLGFYTWEEKTETTPDSEIAYIYREYVEESATTHSINDTYLNNLADFIYNIEEIVAGHIEDKNYDPTQNFENIVTACSQIEALKAVIEANGWETADYEFEMFAETREIASLYKGKYIAFVGSFLERFGIVETIATELGYMFYNAYENDFTVDDDVVVEPSDLDGELDGDVIEDSGSSIGSIENLREGIRANAKVYATIIYDIMKQETNVRKWCEMLEITDEDEILAYEQFQKDNGYANVLSTYLNNEVNSYDYDDESEIVYFLEMIDIVEYLEQLPILLAEDAETKFSWADLQVIAKEAAISTLNNAEFPVSESYDFETGEYTYEYDVLKNVQLDNEFYALRFILELAEYACNSEQSFLKNLNDFATAKLDETFIVNGESVVLGELQGDPSENDKEFVYRLLCEFLVHVSNEDKGFVENIQEFANTASNIMLEELLAYSTSEEMKLVKDLTVNDDTYSLKVIAELMKAVSNKEQGFVENIQDFAKNLSNTMLNDLEVYIEAEDKSVALKDIYYGHDAHLAKVFLDFVNAVSNKENSFKENVDNYIESSKLDVIEYATMSLSYMLDISKEEKPGVYGSLKNIVTGAVNDYIGDEFDAVKTVQELLEFIDNHCDEDRKVIAKATALTGVVLLGKDSDVDFNEMFEDVELPKEIESIDFNKFVEKVWSEETYKDAVVISGVEIQYITDEDDNIVKQVVSIALRMDLDVMISSIKGEFKLNFEIEF